MRASKHVEKKVQLVGVFDYVFLPEILRHRALLSLTEKAFRPHSPRIFNHLKKFALMKMMVDCVQRIEIVYNAQIDKRLYEVLAISSLLYRKLLLKL